MLLRYLVEFVLPDDKVIPRDDVSLDSGFSDEEMEVDEEGTVEIFMMNEFLSCKRGRHKWPKQYFSIFGEHS